MTTEKMIQAWLQAPVWEEKNDAQKNVPVFLFIHELRKAAMKAIEQKTCLGSAFALEWILRFISGLTEFEKAKDEKEKVELWVSLDLKGGTYGASCRYVSTSTNINENDKHFKINFPEWCDYLWIFRNKGCVFEFFALLQVIDWLDPDGTFLPEFCKCE